MQTPLVFNLNMQIIHVLPHLMPRHALNMQTIHIISHLIP
jgi:hypothetical protein